MDPNRRSTSQKILSSLNPRWVFIGLALLTVLWVAFFDSHSLLKRAQWHWEAQSLEAENEQLREETQALEGQIKALEAESTIEEIAREEFGMHRPGETVYRVEYDK